MAKKLIDNDYFLNNDRYRAMRSWLDKPCKEKQELPEPTPIIFPEGTTREDVYPSGSQYKGD